MFLRELGGRELSITAFSINCRCRFSSGQRTIETFVVIDFGSIGTGDEDAQEVFRQIPSG